MLTVPENGGVLGKETPSASGAVGKNMSSVNVIVLPLHVGHAQCQKRSESKSTTSNLATFGSHVGYEMETCLDLHATLYTADVATL